MPPKIKNTFSILPQTDEGLRILCELTHRTYQGDMIDSLVDDELKRRDIVIDVQPDGEIKKMAVSTVSERLERL